MYQCENYYKDKLAKRAARYQVRGAEATYTSGSAHGNTGDTTDLLEADTLQSLARLALGTRSDLVGSVNVGSSIIGVEFLDVELSFRRKREVTFHREKAR